MNQQQKDLKEWESQNDIKTIKSTDELFKWEEEKEDTIRQSQPWKSEPKHFKKVKLSALALLKIVLHANKGGDKEIMGLLKGTVKGDTMIVMDAFGLPVVGTESRVNAGNDAILYNSQYMHLENKVGRGEYQIGWYHSHPGFGCWLSRIDIETQKQYQQSAEPWLAVVIDPFRTASSGRVNIGAFRVWPKDYTPPDTLPSYTQSIPTNKIKDFGVHYKMYYQLDLEFFKSTTDDKLLNLMWNKYWIQTLSSSALVTNKDYISGGMKDLSVKLRQSSSELEHESKMAYFQRSGSIVDDKKDESELDRVSRDSEKMIGEILIGQSSQIVKQAIFNMNYQ